MPSAVLTSGPSSGPPAGTSSAVAGVAPAWVGERIAGAPRPGTVLHAGADAVYVRTGEDVIGVISRHASAVPCAIATRAGALAELFGARRTPRPGDPVAVGGGVVDFGEVAVRVGRLADYSTPRFDPTAVDRMRARLAQCLATGTPSQTAAHIAGVRDEIGTATRDLLATRPGLAVERVMGRGSGLTPVGDDVLCGMLATLLAADDPCAPPLRRQVRRLAPTRTTSLSATLLRRAGDGDALPDFAAVVRALRDDDSGRASAQVERLSRVGHTSGAGMLLGLELALDHLTAPRPRSCRP